MRTYLNSAQPKPCKEDKPLWDRQGVFRSICVRCNEPSFSTNGPSFICIECIDDLRAKLRFISRHAMSNRQK